MSEKKISIICCSYNGEKYIDRCMKTIQGQTIGMESMEVILVNDASTDGTLEKMKQWEQKYPDNILVVTYEINKKPGGARNAGLQYATGEYIGFVDCDDSIEPTMYEKMYRKAKEYDCDVVRCKYSRDKSEVKLGGEIEKGEDKFYTSEDFEEAYPFFMKEYDVGKNASYGSIWSGIYRRNLILDNKIYFPENLCYEDNFWGTLVNLYIHRLYIIDEVLYHYYINQDSVFMKQNDQSHLDRLVIELMLLEELKARGVYEENKKIIEKNFMICFYINTMHTLFARFDTIPDIFPKMREIIKNNFPDYKENEELYTDPLWCYMLQLLDFDPPCTVEELEIVKEKYLELYKV